MLCALMLWGCSANEDILQETTLKEEKDVVWMNFRMTVASEKSASTANSEDGGLTEIPLAPEICGNDILIAVFGKTGKLLCYYSPEKDSGAVNGADVSVSSDGFTMSIKEDDFEDNMPFKVLAFGNLNYLSEKGFLIAKDDDGTFKECGFPSLEEGKTELNDFSELGVRIAEVNSELEYLPLAASLDIINRGDIDKDIVLRSMLARIEIDDELPGGYYIECAKLVKYNTVQALIPDVEGFENYIEVDSESEDGYEIPRVDSGKKFVAYLPAIPLDDVSKKIKLTVKKEDSERQETRTLYIAKHENLKPVEPDSKEWQRLMPNHSYRFIVAERAISNTIRIAWYYTDQCNTEGVKNTLGSVIGYCDKNKFSRMHMKVYNKDGCEITLIRDNDKIGLFNLVKFELNDNQIKDINYQFYVDEEKTESWRGYGILYKDAHEFWSENGTTTFYLNEYSYRSSIIDYKQRFFMPTDRPYRLYFKKMNIYRITIDFGFDRQSGTNGRKIFEGNNVYTDEEDEQYQYIEFYPSNLYEHLLYIEFFADLEDGSPIDELEDKWVANCDIYPLKIDGKDYYVYYFN